MSKDTSISETITQKLKSESKISLTVINELKPPQTHTSKIIETENDKFFQEKYKYLDSTENNKFEIKPEEFKDIEKVYIGGGVNTEAFKNMTKEGVYGDSRNIPTYFTTDYTLACSHIQDTQSALIEIDLKKLLELRKTYRDPESLSIESESGKTFILFNGIPVNAIQKIFIVTRS
jgi:hypothetical protein